MVLPGPKRGRPRKFLEPTRAVTLTLPLSVLARLEAIDADPSRAVVRLAHTRSQHSERAPAAEVTTFGRRAVIVVNPSRRLEKQTGVFLVPIADGRALMAFDQSLTPARLELALEDALQEAGLPAGDADVFASVRDVLRAARRSGTAHLRQCSILVLEFPKGRKRSSDAAAPPPRGRKPARRTPGTASDASS